MSPEQNRQFNSSIDLSNSEEYIGNLHDGEKSKSDETNFVFATLS